MESLWILYWITRLDTLIQTLSWVQGLAGALFLALGFLRIVSSDLEVEEKALAKKWMPVFATVFILTSATKPFIPSKEDAMLIAAGVGITEAVKSETAQRLASKSVAVVEKWLDEQTKDKQEKK